MIGKEERNGGSIGEGRKGKVAFLTLGCKVNAYETNAMEQLFLEAGYELVGFHEKADIYVVNTCTVTNMADHKSRQMLHQAKKRNPDAMVVAVGCYVQAAFEQSSHGQAAKRQQPANRQPANRHSSNRHSASGHSANGRIVLEELEKDRVIDVLIGNNQKKRIVSLVEEFQREKEREGEGARLSALENMGNLQPYEPLSIARPGEKTRAYIKIQDGCSQFCSYCIIPYVRGRVRSRQQEDILEEVRRLGENGYKEVVLTGIHLSSYGVDFSGGRNFLELEGRPLLSLIREVSQINSIERIRLGSLEPRIMAEPFVRELSQMGKVCPHFHLSLQSGCDETLKRMNRKYTTAEYEEGCRLLRAYFENPAITTDVIVGFPEETWEEFEETKDFLRKIAFSDLHIFKYSMRKGTAAAKNPSQVLEDVKHERSRQLIALGKEMQSAYENAFPGKEEAVLLEERALLDGEEYFTGHNERYVKLAIPAGEEDLRGQIRKAMVTEKRARGILCCS